MAQNGMVVALQCGSCHRPRMWECCPTPTVTNVQIEEMFMKRLLALTLAASLAGLIGCESKRGTAPSTNPNKPNETRSIRVTVSSDHTITQGETDDVMVE